jgi:hypothetical protein
MCLPAVHRSKETLLAAHIAAAAQWLEEELAAYLCSAEADFFRYLAERGRDLNSR